MIYSTLFIGYKRQKEFVFWTEFRVWQAICVAAHLERTALVNVIGEKALALLEKVAQLELRPWSIAESLEKLKHPDDAP